MDLDALVSELSAWAYRFSSELELQNGVESVLRRAGLDYHREYVLSAHDRPDFMVGRIAIECKVAGSFAEVYRQVARYADHPDVDAVVVVSSCRRHGEVACNLKCGKPVRSVIVGGIT